MKKVLIIQTSLNGGGAERVLIDLLRHIDRKRYAIDLLLVYGGGVYFDDIPEGINLLGSIFPEGYEFPLFRRILSRLGIMAKYRRQDIERIVKGHYDTIVSFMESRPVKYHSFIMGMADRNISWIHCDLKENHWTRFAFRSDAEEERIYNSMDRIVFVSENIKKSFNRLYDIKDKSKETVIYNAIDKNRILDSAGEALSELPKEGAFYMIAIGRLVPQKNFERLIKATSILQEKGLDFSLDIIGDGPLHKELQILIDKLCLRNKVRLLGYCRNPYPLIKNSSLIVSSSDSEGLPTVLCEAFVLGRPVVATDIPANAELLGESEYGILTGCSAESLAQGIERMIVEPETYKHYELRSVERVGAFSIEDSLNKIYSIL